MFADDDHSRSWAYVYTFADSTLGVSVVRDVEPALRALGARVDPDWEPPQPVPSQQVIDQLAEAIRRDSSHWTAGTFAYSTPTTVTYNLNDMGYRTVDDFTYGVGRDPHVPDGAAHVFVDGASDGLGGRGRSEVHR
jgi:hypothetical protein